MIERHFIDGREVTAEDFERECAAQGVGGFAEGFFADLRRPSVRTLLVLPAGTPGGCANTNSRWHGLVLAPKEALH